MRGLASPHPFLGAKRVVDKGGMYKAGVAGLFHFVLCSFRLVPGPDAWRHGRFGPKGQLCSALVLLVAILLVLCSLLLTTGPRCSASGRVWLRRTVIPRYRGPRAWTRCVHKTVESPQLQSFLFVVIPVVAQMQILMVLHHRVSPAAVH